MFTCSGTLAEAVNSRDIDGMYYDIVCELLEAIFRIQEMEETEETSEDDGKQLLGEAWVMMMMMMMITDVVKEVTFRWARLVPG